MPFDLPEYEDAYGWFLTAAMRGFVEADPLLGRIKESPTSGTLSAKHFSVDGGEVARPERRITLQHTVEWEPVINGELDSFTAAVAEGAASYVEQMTKMLFEELSVITEMTGNVIKKSGGDLTWDDALQMMAKVEWIPDAQGVVRPPDTFVVHPNTAAKMGAPTEAFIEGMTLLQAAKQEEHDARRRRRRLS